MDSTSGVTSMKALTSGMGNASVREVSTTPNTPQMISARRSVSVTRSARLAPKLTEISGWAAWPMP